VNISIHHSMEPVKVQEEELAAASVMPQSGNEVGQESVGGEDVSIMQLNQSMTMLSLNGVACDSASNENLMPSIHRGVLQELDYNRVENNVQIMHDLYLEPSLRLQPCMTRSENDDAQYWVKVAEDIKFLQTSIDVGKRGVCPVRLRLLLNEVRMITEEIHPESERVQSEIRDYFDLDMLVAELECGTFDMARFGQIFADLLQANCAPKRDKLIVKLRQYAIQQNFVAYLRQVLSLLECMKIDLVNYRMSRIRPSLGVKLIAMEKDFWAGQSTQYEDTKTWMKKTMGLVNEAELKEGHLAFHVFANGIVNLTLGLQEELEALPETLVLDQKRLNKLRTEAQDLCITALIISIHNQFAGRSNAQDLALQLFHHLRKDQADVPDLLECLFKSISKNGKILQPSQNQLIASMVNTIVEPDGRAYKIVETRLAKYLVGMMWKREEMALGFEDMAGELQEYAQSFLEMARCNWAVHQETYAHLLL